MRTNLFALGGIECLALQFRSSLVAAIILCAASNPTAAATITNTWSYDPPINGWVDRSFTVPKFDPTNGTLTRLDIIISMRAENTIKLTSGCTVSKTVSYNYTNTFTLSGSSLSVIARVGGRANGTVNPNETVTRANLANTRATTNEIFEPKIQSFVGFGDVPLTMRRGQSVSVDCPGNDCGCVTPSFVSSDVRLDAEFVYVYEPLPELAVEAVSTEGSVLLKWQQTPGFIYVIEKSANFIDWLPVLTNVNSPPVVREVIPTLDESRQFFRLKRTQTGSP